MKCSEKREEKKGKVFISNLPSWVRFKSYDAVRLLSWFTHDCTAQISMDVCCISTRNRYLSTISRSLYLPLWLVTHLFRISFTCSCTLCAAWCRAAPITRRRRWATTIGRLSRCCIDPYAQISISRRRKRTAKPPAPPCTARSTTKVSNRLCIDSCTRSYRMSSVYLKHILSSYRYTF